MTQRIKIKRSITTKLEDTSKTFFVIGGNYTFMPKIFESEIRGVFNSREEAQEKVNELSKTMHCFIYSIPFMKKPQ